MKNSKKIKLLTSLTSLATVAATAALVTSCTNTTNVKNIKTSLNAASAFDINNIGWVVRNIYNSNDPDTIKSTFNVDNNSIYTKFRNLKTSVTVAVTYNASQTKPIAINITIKIC